MKKKIVILGSTGSIGKTTLDIVKKNKKDFKIILLTTNKNIKEILKQSEEFNVKNIIVSNFFHFQKIKKLNKNKNLKIYNSFNSLKRILKKKIDYTMCAISGIEGLKPTFDIIKFTKNIGIANKESIICGWSFINKEIKKNKTNFIPIDSEHFSIWSLIKNDIHKINEIILTASGGPFLNKSKKFVNKVKPIDALKHPNWSMGKKISVDSATMMNKVFEVIEAKKIFNLNQKKFKILIHPKSYIHAIVKYENGLIKMLAHDTNMNIPIFNFLYHDRSNKIKTNPINLSLLNNLSLSNPSVKMFPSLKVLNKLPNHETLYETILISVNDELVKLFLNNKIKFNDISLYLLKIIKIKEFKKYIYKRPINIKEILKTMSFSKKLTNKYVGIKNA